MVLTQTADPELDLVIKAQNGDRSAYGELVRRYFTGVVNVVYRMCGDAGLAEDMAQETFLKAWINLHMYQPRSSLRNWLYRIAVNAALDVLRRKKDVHVPDEIMEMASDQNPGPETAMIQKEQAMQIQKALHSLPEATRSVLVLREYGELSYQEIAAVLEIPIGTVMSRLNYARNRLREILVLQEAQAELEYA